jgi:hypothetical protein
LREPTKVDDESRDTSKLFSSLQKSAAEFEDLHKRLVNMANQLNVFTSGNRMGAFVADSSKDEGLGYTSFEIVLSDIVREANMMLEQLETGREDFLHSRDIKTQEVG